MVFSSPVFLFYFLPLIIVFYFATRRSIYLQNLVLCIGSLLFYFWGEKEYTLLVILSILMNYMFGLGIAAFTRSTQRLLLFLGIVLNLSLLLYFKYYNFWMNEIMHSLFHTPLLKKEDWVHLPLGISFFTFHGLTYITDIYRKEAQVSHNPLNAGLYILFFPQLIAGPIVRYRDMDAQLRNRRLDTALLRRGVQRFIVGLAKKMLIANTCGEVADKIFSMKEADVSGSITWLALICYTFQIYFDFSGYSDMAIGLANMFGFEFPENFRFPYIARSIQDFWRRWHISLSTFFRDYVYIPLGGNQKGAVRTYLHLFTVFFITGLWHGASWNYLIWGLFHGLFLMLERAGLSTVLKRIPSVLQHFYTLFIVVIAWLFFRVEDTTLILFYLKKLFFIDTGCSGIYFLSFFMNLKVALALIAAFVCSMPFHEATFFARIRVPWWMRDSFYILLFLLSVLVLTASTYNPFIYFRF